MSAPWWAEAFGADYLDVYPHRDLESARAEARFLTANGLHGRVLDLCCGWGRHLVALAELGLDSVGVDWSADLLARAASAPGAERSAGRLVRADARSLPFLDSTFDGVVSLFSSFGYFGEDGDAALLAGAGRVLRPEGTCFLDVMNPAHVRRWIVPESRTPRAGGVLTERRTLRGVHVVKDVELVRADGTTRRWSEVVRLYELDELTERLASAGLAADRAWGGFDGSTLAAESPRQLLRVRRARA